MTGRDRTKEFLEIVNTVAKRVGVVLPIPSAQRPRLLDQAMLALRTNSIDPQQATRAALSELHAAQDNAVSEQARLHWFEAERIFEYWQRKRKTRVVVVAAPPRADELRFLQHRLEEVGEQYTVVAELLAKHDSKLTLVDRSVDNIALRIDASAAELRDAAPRRYERRRWSPFPRSLTGKMRCAFGCVVAINVLLIYLAIL